MYWPALREDKDFIEYIKFKMHYDGKYLGDATSEKYRKRLQERLKVYRKWKRKKGLIK